MRLNLPDMLLAARKARSFVERVTEEIFASSELHQSAVMRQLEIIGEAAPGVQRNIASDIRRCRGRS